MPMPGDFIAADFSARGPVGPSRADREQVIVVLKIAFMQGRLTKDEFGTRVGLAFTSQTHAELAEVTADLPAGLMGARLPRQPALTRPRPSLNASISACAFAMLAALLAMVVALVSRSVIALISASAIIAIVGALTFGVIMVAWWRGRAR
jgi:DUF1707 SHOCT-like domain